MEERRESYYITKGLTKRIYSLLSFVVGNNRKEILLLTQKNEIHEIIQSKRMNHAEFKWEEQPFPIPEHGKATMLRHIPSGYYFIFVYFDGERKWVAVYSPGYDSVIERHGDDYWDNILNYVVIWLSNLKRQVGAPDLWAIASQETAIIRLDEGFKDKKFSQKELPLIHERLDKLEKRILHTSNVTEENTVYIKESFEYLKREAKKQRRRAWFLQLVGLLVGIAFQIALQSEGARELFRIVGELFNQFISGNILLR